MQTLRNIVVTTPKSEMATAAKEAEQCIKQNGGFYFRKLGTKPKEFGAGSKLFYVEDGYVRGFAVVSHETTGEMLCETTGKTWGKGFYAVMLARTWHWIKPIPLTGFQGWRYFDLPYEIVGGWQDPKPPVEKEQLHIPKAWWPTP